MYILYDSNPRQLDHEARAQPLCYKRIHVSRWTVTKNVATIFIKNRRRWRSNIHSWCRARGRKDSMVSSKRCCRRWGWWWSRGNAAKHVRGFWSTTWPEYIGRRKNCLWCMRYQFVKLGTESTILIPWPADKFAEGGGKEVLSTSLPLYDSHWSPVG